jgi:hypothetical protein
VPELPTLSFLFETPARMLARATQPIKSKKGADAHDPVAYNDGHPL